MYYSGEYRQKMKETLSSKIYKGKTYLEELNVLDVKEFIKDLKEKLCLGCKGRGCSNCEKIDNIAGEELVNHSPHSQYTGEGISLGRLRVEGSNPSEDIFKHDWSGVCVTTNNRNQCSKDNCILFSICKIKIPKDKKGDKI